MISLKMNWKEKVAKAIAARQFPNSNKTVNIDKLLQPVDKISLESGSDVSDVSDIFAEFHQESFLRPNAVEGKKYLTKNEADWKIVGKFTDEFKKTINEIRKQLDISDLLFDEEVAVEAALNIKKPFHINRESHKKKEEAIVVKRKSSLRSSSGSSTESRTWRLLRANRSEKFVVTSPMYQTFGGKDKHWLERPDVPWNVVERSRIKCEKWMSSNM